MKTNKILNILKPSRIIFPILIGLGVAAYLLAKDFDKQAFLSIHWTWHAGLWIIMAMVMMAVRDLAYMYRIRVLTDSHLTWRKSFDVIMLWEFVSSITPTVVGGSAAAIFIINKEGINIGKSTAIVMTTSLLDELFFILMVPLMYLLVGGVALFSLESGFSVEEFTFGKGLFYFFVSGYVLILIYSLIILYALFANPRVIKWIFIKLFSFPFLRKWRLDASKAGDDLIIASKEIKGKSKTFWFKVSIATFFSWTARYWVVNCLLLIPLAFGLSLQEHFLIYARQLVMWVIMLISPTPGSSGLAEFVFSGFLGAFIPSGLSASMALLWRLISYYPYLFIGVVILPGWLKRVYAK